MIKFKTLKITLGKKKVLNSDLEKEFKLKKKINYGKNWNFYKIYI